MARVEGGAVLIDTDWPGLKAQIDTRNINFKYEEDATAYEIFAVDGQYFYKALIYKSGQAPQDQSTYDTYRTEFEASYKARITDFTSTQPFFLSNVDGYSVVLKDGATPTANDGYGIAVIGYDGSNYRMLKSDSSGRPVLVGAGTAGTPAGGVISIQGVAGGTSIPISGSITANNASVSDNDAAIPLFSTLIGGSDGTNLRPARIFDVDTGGGQQWVLGVGLRKAAGGGSVELGTSSDPIRIDTTGTTTQPVSGTVTANAGSGTFTVGGTVTANAGTGNFTVVQSTASNLRAQLASESSTGAAITSTAVMVGGSDGTNLRSIFVDTSGRPIIVGAAANGAAVAGNPVLIAGSDGTNARSIKTASDGTVRIDPTGTTIQPVSGTITANAGSGTFTVSGTVTANIGTSGSLALDATLAKLTITQGTALGSNTQALVGGSVTTAAPSYTTGNINPFSLTTAGALRIDGSGVTQPISGTVTANAGTGTFTVSGTVAATQSGTWTVQPGNTANTTPWLTTISQGGNSATVSAGGALKIDGSAVTQPVSGTVTANIGTTNGLALDTSINGILLAQNSTTSGQTGPIIQGAVTTSAPSYTTAKTSPLSLTTAGALRTDSSATTQPVSGTITANAGSGTFTVSGTVTSNIGTTNGLALDATLTGGTQTTRITDGTNTATVKAASTAAGATDKALVVAISPNNSVAVTGTITANIGTTNGLALDTSVNGILLAQNSTTSGQTGSLIQGAVTTASPSYTTAKTSPLSLTTAGALRVDGSAVTQPVSGTVTANAGSGTFTVGGTVTANIGTSGSLALDATLAKLTIAQGASLGSNTQALTGGSVTTAAPTYTTGQISPISLTTAGAIRIDGSGATQPVSGTVTANQGGAPWSENITQFGGVSISTGTGASGTGIPRVTVANDSNILATQSGTWTVQPGNTANTTPWLATINQGSNSASVKAASTAAATTDPALVVAISPNNSIAITNADVTGTGTLNALNTTASVALSGHNTVGMQLLAGTLVGTIVPEISVDGGTTWVATFFDDPTTSNIVSSIVFGASNTATTRSIVGCGGASNARVRVSSFTSGTATCNIRTSITLDPSTLYGGAAGSVLPPVMSQIGGSVTTAAPSYTTATLNALSLTTAGALRVDGSAVTQPISGTVTANIGTSGSLALDATLSAQSLVDNAGFTDGTSRVVPSGYIFDEVAGTALTENDTGAARMDSKRAIINVIEDGTTRGTRAAVKAASTAAGATDPALVVAISPNNTISVGAVTVSQSDTTATGSLGALNATVSVALAGTAGAGMQLVAGTLIGTIVPEISTDGGTTWVTGSFFDPVTGVLASSIVFASSNTATTKTNIITGGASHIRVRVSVYTSGTATCNLRATTANDPSTAIRGTDGTVLRTVLLDTSGRIIVAPAGASSTTSGFSDGQVVLATTTQSVIFSTTYTEQSSNAQRSIVSSSASDASAGTGARTVQISYYSLSAGVITGPFTETITMNGTSAVNTVSTTICYVEKIIVLTVGSNTSNVGTLSLKAATAGGGATVWSIAVGVNKTYGSQHYVPNGKTAYITGIVGGIKGADTTSIVLSTVDPTSASAAQIQISDTIRVPSSGQTIRTYGTPIQVAGPSHIQAYALPDSSSSRTYYASFDFYEQ